MKLLLFLFGALVVCATAEKIRYDNYHVYRIIVETEDQIKELERLEIQTAVPFNVGFSFWKSAHRIEDTADIIVSPQKIDYIVDILERGKFNYNLIIENVQALFDSEIGPRRAGPSIDWLDYYPLGNIYYWLQEIADKYPQVEVIKGGESYEGRDILGVKISYKKGNPGVFIESGIHAREWITPAAVTYIVNELLTSTNFAVRQIAENYDWYVFPSVNPDGYEYTHTTNRLWRKTRSPQGVCIGVDANRNWGYKWMVAGSSSLPCMETFAGKSAFSEIETRSLSEYIASIQDRIQTYLAFHSYSQLLLIPYGHTKEHLENYDDLMSIGKKAVSALARRYGTKYTYGNIYEVIYPASGGSMDWVKANFQTPITYTYELRDKGLNGFVLPAEQIIPTGEETLDSVITILETAKALGYYEWTD